MDSGIRRGTDVLTALALGARAVLVGRPVLFALPLGGEAAVGYTLDLLRNEIDRGLALQRRPTRRPVAPRPSSALGPCPGSAAERSIRHRRARRAARRRCPQPPAGPRAR